MIAALKPYPAMKDSGVPWLGHVPKHWGVLPNRALFDEIKDRDHPDEQMLSVTIKQGVIRQAALLEDTSKKDSSNLDRSSYKLVRPGDIVYNKMRAWQGAVGVSAYRGIVSPAYVVQRPRAAADSRYFHHLLRTPAFAQEAERWSYGITSDMWSLRPEHFKMIYACLPPLPEQTTIVRYLDYTDRRVARYIRAQQRLIALLEEQKQAIIQRAVTRGLDPDVPLKPSGVEWLGDVPDHWQVRQLGRMGRFSKGSGGTREDDVIEGVSCIRYGDLYMHHKFFIRASNSHVTRDRAASYTPIQYGDVLFASSGETIEEIGKSAVNLIESEACCGGDVILFRPAIHVDPEFMGYATDCPQAVYQKSCMGRGFTVMHIYRDQLKYLWVALPPVPEQAAIAHYLRETTARIDTAADGLRSQIELVREYHTRLIADVVTGKLDVCDVAIDEAAEADAPDDNGVLEDEEDTLMSAGEEDAHDA
jgi:type I restriction enzyme S subunit